MTNCVSINIEQLAIHAMPLKILAGSRECYACGTQVSEIHRKSGRTQAMWFHNYDERGSLIGYLCNGCYNKYVDRPRNYQRVLRNNRVSYHRNIDKRRAYDKERASKAILFKGNKIRLDENPKIGVCNLCRAVVPFDAKKTHMHHFSYNEENPLFDALEICPKCHAIWHWKNGGVCN